MAEDKTSPKAPETEPARPKGTSKARNKRSRKKGSAKKRAATAAGGAGKLGTMLFPKHSVLKAIRIPQAVLENNAGRDCTDREAATFAGLGWTGSVQVEISSAIKYGLFSRPNPGRVQPTDLIRRIVRPQKPNDKVDAIRECILNAPLISDMYKHYRGENLPEESSFLINTATETFKIPADRVAEFLSVFMEDLEAAQLIEDVGGKKRVLDITHTPSESPGVSAIKTEDHLKKVSKGVSVAAGDSCFVIMPFADPIGGYYELIYEPAIKKTGLTPVRADTDIFGTGKIIEQIWVGLKRAKVLVAELTGRNPNVLYELGLAHALHKPVVLISSNEDDVPFDVRHVRVIYYDVNDPFWGDKLIAKVAENVASALANPNDAIQFKD